MAFACKICIAEKGLKGEDVASLPQTEEELTAHIEITHKQPVLDFVRAHGEEGCTVREINEELGSYAPLFAGVLTHEGRLKVIGGGGEESYRLMIRDAAQNSGGSNGKPD